MTFSLIAHCKESGQFGVVATTAVPAVGKLLTHARAKVGAVATQARLNPYVGIDGLKLLGSGHAAEAVLEKLKVADPCFQQRQFAVIDRNGDTAAWTGNECLDWAGHKTFSGFSVQGNRLEGPEVLAAIEEAFRGSEGDVLSRRLIRAIAAGGKAGGDREGARSATLYLVDSEDYPLWDIRVDDYAAPIEELKRLYDVFEEKVIPHIREMPTRENPGGSHGKACI